MSAKNKTQRRRDAEVERTCVHCGCTDSRACAGGCSWLEKHPATPTGVCSNCPASLTVGDIAFVRSAPDRLVLQHRAGEAMQIDEAKLAKVLEKFFWKEF